MPRTRHSAPLFLLALAACGPREDAPRPDAAPHGAQGSVATTPEVAATASGKDEAARAPAAELAPRDPDLVEPRPERIQSRVEDPPNPKVGDLVKVQEFHENGQLATERTERVEEGGRRVRTGPMKIWWEDGAPYVVGAYDEQGRKTGPWKYWRREGQLALEGEYHENLREGVWIENYPNGQRRSEGFVHVGLLEGAWKYWHENGRQLAEGEYVNSLRQGPWYFWNEDGSLDEARSGTYKDHARVE
jgi:hypothetical protein